MNTLKLGDRIQVKSVEELKEVYPEWQTDREITSFIARCAGITGIVTFIDDGISEEDDYIYINDDTYAIYTIEFKILKPKEIKW